MKHFFSISSRRQGRPKMPACANPEVPKTEQPASIDVPRNPRIRAVLNSFSRRRAARQHEHVNGKQ